MLDALIGAVDRISTRPRFLLMLTLTVAVIATVNLVALPWTLPTFRETTHGLTILDMQFHYGAEQAYQAIDAYGPAGRALYMHILWPVDVIIPFVAASTLAMAITLGWRSAARSHKWLRYMGLLGLCAGLTDYCENIAITALLVSYPTHLDGVATCAGYLTSAKHLLYVTSFVLAVAGGIKTLLERRRSPAHFA
jgi:hypothetical protein